MSLTHQAGWLAVGAPVAVAVVGWVWCRRRVGWRVFVVSSLYTCCFDCVEGCVLVWRCEEWVWQVFGCPPCVCGAVVSPGLPVVSGWEGSSPTL